MYSKDFNNVSSCIMVSGFNSITQRPLLWRMARLLPLRSPKFS